MKKILITSLSSLVILFSVQSQNVGIGTPSPDASALLDIRSTNKGVLIPRMTAVQRNAITTPAVGLMVFDNDSSSLFIFQQSQWKKLNAISNLNDLLTGTASENVIAWNGSEWQAVPLSSLFTYLYGDRDGDGFGDKYNPLLTIGPFPGFIADSTDCNDNSVSSFPGAVDLPDEGFIDSNCDGIDGTESAAIFVATSGNNANPGTKLLPVQTIAMGISRAIAQGKSQIYVSMGVYATKVTISNGISIYGGYNAGANWGRSAYYTTIIQNSLPQSGRISALEGANITTPTIVDRVSIQTGNAIGTGIHNYAVYCLSCTALTISNSLINSGNGSSGANGFPGVNGTNGVAGSNGNGGSCSSNVTATGGSGGIFACTTGATNGGNGGNGGYGNQNGTNGTNGALSGGGFGIGGAGGTLGNNSSGNPGANGTDGQNGANGVGGSGGNSGGISGNFWFTNNGSDGATGARGGGGGAGGGGGGFFVVVDIGTGNGGGGGGAGGCPGTGGRGGLGGGASFGMLLVSSTGIILTNNIITSGNGGTGGNGGIAGTGGLGSNGGIGASVCTSSVGKGGNGGAGGDGGAGGGGGGGAGGPSFSIGRYGTTVSILGNTLSFGNGGAGGIGGASGGNPGGTGSAGSNGTVFVIL